MDSIDDFKLLKGLPMRPGTKLASLLLALHRPHGTTRLQLMLITVWQPHSVRGATMPIGGTSPTSLPDELIGAGLSLVVAGEYALNLETSFELTGAGV